MKLFSRWQEEAAPPTAVRQAPRLVDIRRVDLSLVDAQITGIEIARVRPEPCPSEVKPLTQLQINLRQAGALPSLKFVLYSTDGFTPTVFKPATSCHCSWSKTGTDGLLDEVLNFFAVRTLSAPKGRFVRVLVDSRNEVWSIGDFLAEHWLTRLGDSYRVDGRTFFHGLRDRSNPIIVDQFGESCLLCEIYTAGYNNARIKMATLVPGANDSMEVLLKLTDITPSSWASQCHNLGKELTIRYRPNTMAQLTALLNGLCDVAGIAHGNFERLSGRLVRYHGVSAGEISTSRIEAEAARHFSVQHPILTQSVDMADYNGAKEWKEIEEQVN